MPNPSEIRDESVRGVLFSAEPQPALYSSEISGEAWRIVAMLLIVVAFQGYAAAIPTIAAPWFRVEFHLNDRTMPQLFAGFALSAFGALALARMADRVGRRRVLKWSAFAAPMAAIGAGLATNIFVFVAFMIAVEAFIGAALACSVVMLAETLPVLRRAEGQSWAGLAAAVGGGLCVFLAPVLPRIGFSWRWLMAFPASGLLFLPMAVRAIPESARWEQHLSVAAGRRSHFYDIFAPIYRRRSLTIIACSLLATFSVEGVNSYSYFHAVSVIGLSADFASALTIIGGGLGMIGFPVGAWMAERFGRVPTIVSCGAATSAVALSYFWGPPHHFDHPALWLGAAFLLMNAAMNAAVVASNAAVTELFPTALRGTILGWYALMAAFGAVSAELTISKVAPAVGGISMLAGWLSLLGIPGAILFGMMIDETRGLTLDVASKERAFGEEE
jgi:MFS family permease